MPEPQPARPSLLRRFLAPWARPAAPATAVAAPPAAKAFPATGVQFVGPRMVNGELVWLAEENLSADAEKLTRLTAFVVSAYCYTAMDWRASRLAEAPLMVVRETKAGEEWQKDHPLATLLDQPRPDIEMGEILKRTSLYWDQGGQALWVIDRNGLQEPAMVTPFADSEFESEQRGDLIYGAYRVRTRGGWKPVGPELGQTLVHFRDVDPCDWRTPLSKVDAALAQLNLGHTVNRIVKNFLSKAMFPGGIVSPSAEWHPTPGEWDTWKELLKQYQAGPQNSGELLALPGGTTFSRAAAELATLLPQDIMDRVETTVGGVFGTPPVVLGWKVGLENSPWSSYVDARRSAYEDTAAPKWTDVGNRLTRALFSPEERRAGFAIRFDTGRVKALQPDREANARTSALVADIWRIKERRILTGQEPLGDERDDVIVGMAAAPAPDTVGTGPAGKTDTADLTWLIFDADTKAAESTWERAVYAFLQGQRTAIAAAAATHIPPAPAPAKSGSGDGVHATKRDAHEFQHHLERIIAEGRSTLVATTYPLYVGTGGKAVRRLTARLGLRFDVLEPGLLKYAKEASSFLAQVMGETTGQAVAAAVQEGLNAGETVGVLVKRLEDLSEFDRPRARLTARTETTRAWNGAQRRSLSEFSRSSGRTVQKTWLNSRDDRVREEHSDETGVGDETVSIDQPFSNGLMEPGEPNCRCTLSYTVSAAAAGEGDTDVEETP